MRHLSIQYRLSSLFILMAITGACACWVTWPQRTAIRFARDHFEQEQGFTNPFTPATPEAATWRPPRTGNMRPAPHKRTWWDVVMGRQTFDWEMKEFKVVRGKVTEGPTDYFESYIRFYR